MSLDTLFHVLLPAISLAAVGLAFGLGYFRLLRLTVNALTSASGWRRPLVLTLGRIGGAVLLLGLATRFGALPLLAVFGGFLVARGLALRGPRSAA